jgi:signal transduction histidine kinase
MISFIRQRVSLKYLVAIILSIGLIFTVLFVWLSYKHKAFIMAQVEKQAVILHRQIVLTRQWVSDHGYILVAGGGHLTGGHQATDEIRGKVYTRITPAGLTRQLSDYASSQHLFAFNLTNLKTKNPANRPDVFEAEAITLFKQNKEKSVSRVEVFEGRHVFRYAAPLEIQSSCLACHADQGFQVGDIGGCISVLIPFEETRQAIHRENISLFFAMLGLTLTVVLVLFFLTQKLIFSPIRDIRQFTAQMHNSAPQMVEGDELKEFKQLCYVLDEKLRDQHNELSRNIARATAELAEANEELKVLNTAKSNFLADISHELRTPLTSIKGAVDYLLRKGDGGDPAHLEIIRKNAEHLIRTVVDFMDYARMETGHLELDYGSVDLVKVAQEVVDAQQPDLIKKGLTVRLNMPAEVLVQADGYRLYQVIANLLSNAIKFSPPSKSVEVDIEKDGGTRRAGVTIKDRGPGVPLDQQESIFQKFYQGPQPAGIHPVSRQASSGIGLAICKGLVEAHGGSLWVQARNGGGSIFGFSLPVYGKT